jgi:molecular chaperone GrpE
VGHFLSAHWQARESGYSGVVETVSSDRPSSVEEPAQAVDSPIAEPTGGEAGSASDANSPAESELDTLRGEAARLKDQLLRLAADFDNYRKRSRREIADAEKAAREEQLRELLPVFDNLERAHAHAAAATDVQALADGIGMVNKQFQEVLSKLGVERVPGLGQPFDPAVHEAIQQLETTEVPAGSVAAEILAGYRAGDRLIRPAMVVVAKPPSDPA